ncbi:MAG: protein kinase [Vicinamibacterales bacterium]
MSLSAGHRLGTYQVVGALGEGGMGEVYRARDTKLNRDVAIKILPELFALDSERLARLTREAQTLASLNHPNIAQIYGLEGDDSPGSTRALVMELVDGDDLSVLIARGPVPLPDALPIARQIADALEAAHEQGIVRRDLKPANVKVRHDGTVKVLDFGLAKAMDPAGSYAGGSPHASPAISPTLTARHTQIGMIIGTAAYMAPEQARGRLVDKRADIWAFGVVLYEMLTGRRAFGGDDMSDVLASVLKTEPDWQAVPVETPAAIGRLLRRCLEKEPRKRLSAIGDARLELDETEPAAGVAPASTQSRRPSIGIAMTGGLVAIAVLATAGITWFATRSGSEKPNRVSTHLSIALPDGDEVTDKHMLPLAISPDGTRVAYIALHNGVRQMFLRNLTDVEATIVAGTETARSPFFSPDGQWIGFFAEEKVKRVAVGSGAVQIVAGGAQEPRGASWGSDGNIYYTPSNMAGVWKYRPPAAPASRSRGSTCRAVRSAIAGRRYCPTAS